MRNNEAAIVIAVGLAAPARRGACSAGYNPRQHHRDSLATSLLRICTTDEGE